MTTLGCGDGAPAGPSNGGFSDRVRRSSEAEFTMARFPAWLRPEEKD
jgi:hypothetical protein